VNFKITYRPEAELDIEETARWYEKQRINLGFEFVNEVEKKGEFIETNPHLYQKVYKSVHRAVLERFPFNVFYFIEDESVVVIAVMHGSRHPKKWQKRVK